MSSFRVGQKVVCVEDGYLSLINAGPTVYTVGAVITLGLRTPHLVLAEMITGGESSSRFRPVVTRKTDISIFKAMLNPHKQEERA